MSSSSPLEQLKQEIVKVVLEKAGVDIEPSDLTIPEPSHGDLALPMFTFAGLEKISPAELAKRVAEAIGTGDEISAVAVGPYVNFFFTRRGPIMMKIFDAASGGDYGQTDLHHSERMLLEYVSPNTNKPLHLGHLRNAALGWSLAQIFGTQGYEVIKAQIVNDRGIHIMKPLLAYERWGNKKTPESENEKGDHFVARYYVMYGEEAKKDPSLDDAAQELLRQWETNEEHVRELWENLRQWTIEGHEITYKRIGISFDRNDFESDIYEDGKRIARDAVTKGLARQREDGAIVIDLKDEKEKVLLRADGTSVYITQDLALAKKRFDETQAARFVYVVGQEQDYQFTVLFEVLDKLGIAKKENLKQVSYHHVLLPEGRMKSREGTVVDTDNLLDELHALAAEEVLKRSPELDKPEADRRAEIIALAAAKYYLLRVRPNSDITFSPKESIAFVGNTGPYLLYTYARIQSILRKIVHSGRPEASFVSPSQWAIAVSVAQYPDIVSKAATMQDPSLLTDFCFTLAKQINDFYERESIIKSESDDLGLWRIKIITQAANVLKNGLTLLGIETLDEM